MEGKQDAECDRLDAVRRGASEEALTALRIANSHVAGTERLLAEMEGRAKLVCVVFR